VHGILSLAYTGDRAHPSAIRLTELEQRAPLRVLFPHDRECGVPQAVLVTTSGGLVGGDLYEIDVDAGRDSALVLTTQAAEKVYRSMGADTRIDVRLTAAPGSWLEWMPQETILFEGSRLHRRTTVELATDARLLAGEIVVFGRTARGEAFTRGLLRDAWRIRVAGRLVWADTLLLEDDIAGCLAAAAGFDGAVATASLVYAAEDAASRLDAVRATLCDLGAGPEASKIRLAATCINDQLLVVRGLARDAFRLRTAVTRFWRTFRTSVGLPPALPRIWAS
jgi:Urease accessory protein UreH